MYDKKVKWSNEKPSMFDKMFFLVGEIVNSSPARIVWTTAGF